MSYKESKMNELKGIESLMRGMNDNTTKITKRKFEETLLPILRNSSGAESAKRWISAVGHRSIEVHVVENGALLYELPALDAMVNYTNLPGVDLSTAISHVERNSVIPQQRVSGVEKITRDAIIDDVERNTSAMITGAVKLNKVYSDYGLPLINLNNIPGDENVTQVVDDAHEMPFTDEFDD